MTTLTVRRARPADSERIRELNELAMSETPEWVPDAPDADLRDVRAHYLEAGGEFLAASGRGGSSPRPPTSRSGSKPSAK